MSEERRPPEDHGWRGLASGGWAAGPVGLIVPEARAGWVQSRRRNWVAVAAANRKGRNRPAGWRELARLVASLARTRVTSARARIARCRLKAQLRVLSCVRGRCFAVVSLRRSLRFFGRGRALACLSLHVRARSVPDRRVTAFAAEFWVGVAADGRGARAWHGRAFFVSPGFHSGGRCVVYSPRCGARGLGRHRPCACVPTAVPARAARFGSAVRFFFARALK